MEFLKYNPMKDIAKQDEGTKELFADAIGKALLGKQVIDPRRLQELKNGRFKYAPVGIHRKLDLCDDLRKHADKLQGIVQQREAVEAVIRDRQELIDKKPQALEENHELNKRKDELDRELQQQKEQNKAFREHNDKLARDITSLRANIKAENEKAGTSAHQKLNQIAAEFQNQAKIIEEEIAQLELRKAQLIDELNSTSDIEEVHRKAMAAAEEYEVKRRRMEDEMKTKQRDFLEMKDGIEALHAKVSVQVRRSRDDLNNK